MPRQTSIAVGLATILLTNVLAAGERSNYVIEMEIEAALDRQREKLMGRPGAVGVGLGHRDGKPAIVLMVEKATPEALAGLPNEIEGYPLVVEVVGKITAY